MTRFFKLVVAAVLVVGCGVTGEGQIGDDDTDGDGSGDETFTACEHIDVVIAVDNSGSMKEEKDALREIAFPGFAQALIAVAGGIEDFRVGVVDACPNPATFHTRGAGGSCDFQGGDPWMSSSSSALVDEFRCVGDIDSSDAACSGSNDDEQPATAAAAALEPAFAGPGMPNAGFSRDDALLVVVAITDEDETPTPDASAQEVYDRIVATKGDPSQVVFVGIGGAQSCDDGAYGSAERARVLRETTSLFEAQQRGVFWDLCEGDLEQGLAQALATIDSACQDFGPVL